MKLSMCFSPGFVVNYDGLDDVFASPHWSFGYGSKSLFFFGGR